MIIEDNKFNSNQNKFHPAKSGTKEEISGKKHINIEPSLKELIEFLDDKSKILPYSAERIYIKFPSKLSINDFNILFKKGINYAKLNYSLLKLLLSALIDDKPNNTSDIFGLRYCTELQKIFKIDLIFRISIIECI